MDTEGQRYSLSEAPQRVKAKGQGPTSEDFEKETPLSSPLPLSAFSVGDSAVPDVRGSTQAISSEFCNHWMQMVNNSACLAPTCPLLTEAFWSPCLPFP